MNRLRELRQKKKLSQKEFAAAFNKFQKNSDFPIKDNHGNVKKTSYATVSRWESGQTPIPSIYFSSLADFFEVSAPYLQGFTANKETDNLSKNKRVFYSIDTNGGGHYGTDTLSFKQMGGQQFLECSGHCWSRTFINTAQIIAIEEREEEDVKND